MLPTKNTKKLTTPIGMCDEVEWILMIVTGLGVPIPIMIESPCLGLILIFQFHEEKRWLLEASSSFDSSKER